MEVTKLSVLVDGFADSAIQRDEALISGDGKRSRQYATKLVHYWKGIKRIGAPAKDEMVRLLRHPHPSARVAAAAFLLKYRTEEAMAVLQEAAQHSGLVPLSARECIKRWEEGTWALD